jgi:hypothetical protein
LDQSCHLKIPKSEISNWTVAKLEFGESRSCFQDWSDQLVQFEISDFGI